MLIRRVDNPESPFVARWKYRLYDRVITISEGIRQVLLAEGVDPELLVSIRSAVSPDAYRARCDTAWFRQQAAAAQKSGDKTGTATRPAAPEVADTQLLDLARARAESVKDYLVTTFKIPADHLVGCRPRIETDADKGAAPRTDLLI